MTDGKNVVASNDENLIGLSSEGINIIQTVNRNQLKQNWSVFQTENVDILAE